MSQDNNLVDLQLGQDEFAPAVADVLRSLSPRASVEGVTGTVGLANANEPFRVLRCKIGITTNTLDDALLEDEPTVVPPSDVWVIQLDRTSYRHDTNRVTKILRRVDFPIVMTRTGATWDLVGVVTHRGRTAWEAGDVCAWVRDAAAGSWIRVNIDTTRTSVTESDITQLRGGGDWHMACLLFLPQAKLRERERKENKQKSDSVVLFCSNKGKKNKSMLLFVSFCLVLGGGSGSKRDGCCGGSVGGNRGGAWQLVE